MATKPQQSKAVASPKANVPANVEAQSEQLPAHLRKKEGQVRGARNTDATDLVIPRVKLLQGLSPEVVNFNGAEAGYFWQTMLDVSLGKEIRFIPIIIKKKYILFNPKRDDPNPILARAEDGMNWDKPNTQFDVKLKGGGKASWNTGENVRASGLAEFGTFNPSDEDDNKPAATLIYEMLVYLPDHPDKSPAVFSLQRSQIKPGKNLLGKIEAREQGANGVMQHFQVYKATVTEEQSADGPYFNMNFLSDGFADEHQASITEELVTRFATTQFKAHGEEGLANEENETGGASNKPRNKEF